MSKLPPRKRDEVVRKIALLLKERRFRDAQQGIAILLSHNPRDADALFFRGTVHLLQSDAGSALDDLALAARLQPGRAAFLSNLGVAQMLAGKAKDARESLERATQVDPSIVDAWASLTLCYRNNAMPAEAAAAALRATNLDPTNAGLLSTAISTELYAADLHLVETRARAERYGALLSDGVTRFPARKIPAKRLRIGLVSADLRSHPVGRFLLAVLPRLDADVFAYSNHADAPTDPVTRSLRAAVSEWKNILTLDDENAASLIHRDEIDVLFDLSGHTSGNRLGIFARKPAPVAVTWLGFPGTTGLTQIDYNLGNAWTFPEGEDAFYVETPWRLPSTYNCYAVPDAELPIAPLPMLKNGYVTFGSANNFGKLTDATIATWSKILQAVPNSRLILRSSQDASPDTAAFLLGRLTAYGAHPAAIRIDETIKGHEANMAQYAEIDVALDPFPYTGATTTVEALYMGVPVITLRGKGYAALQGVSILSCAGLQDWIADDIDEYVSLAKSAAKDVHRIESLRATLRPRVVASPLFDASQFAGDLQQALSEMAAIHNGKS